MCKACLTFPVAADVKDALQEMGMNKHRFVVAFSISMIGYMVILIASVLVLNAEVVEGNWNTIVALTPMVPGFAVAFSVMRQVRISDELQRRIQLEALSLAFGGTALVTFSYGFLETVGYPKLSMFFVWPIMAVFWIVGGLISGRRFR